MFIILNLKVKTLGLNKYSAANQKDSSNQKRRIMIKGES